MSGPDAYILTCDGVFNKASGRCGGGAILRHATVRPVSAAVSPGINEDTPAEAKRRLALLAACAEGLNNIPDNSHVVLRLMDKDVSSWIRGAALPESCPSALRAVFGEVTAKLAGMASVDVRVVTGSASVSCGEAHRLAARASRAENGPEKNPQAFFSPSSPSPVSG